MTIQSYFISLLVAIMLLTPVINIDVPFGLKSLDVYANMFFLAYVLFEVGGNKGKLKQKKIFQFVFIAMAFFLVQMLFLECTHNHGDYTGIKMIARITITIIASYGCARLLIERYKDASLNFFIKVVIACALIQGFVLWFTLLNPNFRNFMSILFYRNTDVASHLFLLRTPGFVPTGGDGLSMNHGLLTMVGLIGTFVFFQRSRYQFTIVILLLFSMLAAVLPGRSGFYLSALFAVIVISTRKAGFQVTPKFQNVFLSCIIIALPIMFLAPQLGTYGQALADKYSYEYPLVRLLIGFIKMSRSGTYSDNTIYVLINDMVIIPENLLRFFIGNNDFGQLEQTRIMTDVGYFRMWHGMGLIGLVLFLVLFFFLPIFKLQNLKKTTLRYVRSQSLIRIIISHYQMLLFVLIFGLLGHYKIFYLSSRIFLFVFFVLLFLTFNFYYSILRNHSMQSYKNQSCAD